MDWAINLFSEDKTIEALANLFGIIAGCVVLWSAGKFLWQFINNAYRNSLLSAWRAFKKQNARFALSSAKDIFLFSSRLALMSVAILLACTGILTTVISNATRTEENMKDRFSDQILFVDFETYKNFTEAFEALGAIFLMIALSFSALMFLNNVRGVQRLRKRWRRRGRLK